MKKTIILANDDSDLLFLYSVVIGKSKVGKRRKIINCLNGQKVLDLIDSRKVSLEDIILVITDLKMPSVDGKELIRELRVRNYLGPIVVLTNSVEALRDEYLRKEASDIILTPLGNDSLLRRIGNLL
ncbi:MAG: response regulator [Patescibacteria group bacterium]|nr:response regulator [Patescibacteria group bacterium]